MKIFFIMILERKIFHEYDFPVETIYSRSTRSGNFFCINLQAIIRVSPL